MSPQSVFFDFTLPNATTWFYFSLLLAVALFFKFSRLLSMRNWDVLTLFLLVPGLLLLQAAHLSGSRSNLWFGYLWLMCGSGYFLLRCLVDLTLVRRPSLSPNLNLGGLAWLACALAVCLVSVALRQSHGPAETAAVGKDPAAVAGMEKWVDTQVKQQPAVAAVAGVPNSFKLGRTLLALFCHLAIVAGLVFVGYRHFQDLHAGMAAATFYLLLPYTAIHIGQVHHVWPIALLIWAVAAYRKPMLAGLLLGLAAAHGYFPAVVFPIWLSFYWRRGAGRFATAFLLAAALSLSATGAFLWMQGSLESSLYKTLALSDWQPWKQPQPGAEGFEGFWRWMDGTYVHLVYRIPVFIAYLAFLVTTAFWPNPKNLAHVLALTAAGLIGIQFWYADQGGVYVLWYLPLLLLIVFRPNLAERLPPAIASDSDWLSRCRRWIVRLATRLLRLPEPVAHVH